MKELDFDELDKAVNTLMAKVPDDKKAPAAPPAAKPAAAPAKPAAPATVTPSMEPKAPAKLVVPSRASGRFMDVMHPSSDMRTPTPVTPPSREGMTITPPAGLKAPTTPVKPPAAAAKAPAPAEMPKPADKPADTLSADDTEPAFSPFLPDTKVEKRPLGGAQPADEPSEDAPEPPAEGSEAPAEEEKPKVLPAELKADVIAIEADNEHEIGTDLMPEHAFKPPAKADPLTSDKPAVPEPTSIVQQYKEQPSSSDQSHQAIYDTAPAPLIHTAKKKSSWWIVVWVVLLLLVGAGGAALLYFLNVI